MWNAPGERALRLCPDLRIFPLLEGVIMVEVYRPTLSEVLDGTELTEAEGKLLAACKTGGGALCGSEVPGESTNGNHIRGSLIRYLLLGGCPAYRPNPKGVRAFGAWIDGPLDFEGCESGLDLSLPHCRFPEEPVFQDAKLGGVYLTGSLLESGLNLHRIETENSVHLSDEFRCEGTVDLGGAKIGGALSCLNGAFINPGDIALNCDAMTVGADVFLRDGFEARGQTILRGAQIGGQLDCTNGMFNHTDGIALNCNAMTVGASVFMRDGFKAQGQVILRRAQIGGQLACSNGAFINPDGTALNCDAMTVGAEVLLRDGAEVSGGLDFVRASITGNFQISNVKINGNAYCNAMRVGEALTWQQVKGEVGFFDLLDARVGKLRDDAESWKSVKLHRLTDFRYDAVEGAMRLQDRLDTWLGKNFNLLIKDSLGNDTGQFEFEPQPYSQLALVLEGDGKRRAAARVLFEREKLLRRTEHARSRARIDGSLGEAWSSLLADFRRFVDFGYGALFGYGHRPFNALMFTVFFVAAAAIFYGTIYNQGQMAPNSDVILTSEDWVAGVVAYDTCDTDCMMPLRAWEGTPSYQDYETFSPFLYGLDLFVPLDALGQETAWAPSKDRGAWGFAGYYARWLFQLMGWILTATGAAVLTGLVGRKD